MDIAVIGSRDFPDKKFVQDTLQKLFYLNYTHAVYDRLNLITGGARGVDTWAMEYFTNLCGEHSVKIIRPVNPASKIDYLYRNIEIITLAYEIIAFWDGKSRGTKFVIDYAKARGKRIKVYTM